MITNTECFVSQLKFSLRLAESSYYLHLLGSNATWNLSFKVDGTCVPLEMQAAEWERLTW